MKTHEVKTREYQQIIERFKEWLRVLGYAESTVNTMPNMLREFFNYLENMGIISLSAIERQHTENYIVYIKTRKNNRRPGALSISQINKHIDLLYKLSEYLRKTLQTGIPVTARKLPAEQVERVVLSMKEVKRIYEQTDETLYGMRDRAMLAVYYGCGLRKSEGINLELSDILFDRKLVYVRKAKNNHERYVPVTSANLKMIEQYIYNARPLLLGENSKETGLFISERGRTADKHTIYLRIKHLASKAGISKEIGLHTLRHSIATHLLKNGIELEHIALFLGHRCLDSTQVYTHLANEMI